MNCFACRRHILSDPYHLDEETRAHLAECGRCQAFMAEIRALDEDIREVSKVAVPEGLAARILLNQSITSYPRRPTRWYWLGMAASFFLAAVIVFQVFRPPTLHAEILQHMDHEEHQVHGRSGDLAHDYVRSVLLSVDGTITETLGTVTYASNCIIDDMVVAHLVVEHGDETYTVLLIPEGPDTLNAFRNDRWLGRMVPHPSGSLAIIMDASHSEASLDAAMGHFTTAIGYRAF